MKSGHSTAKSIQMRLIQNDDDDDDEVNKNNTRVLNYPIQLDFQVNIYIFN